MMWREVRCRRGEVELEVIESPVNGPPVLFVPGFGSGLHSYDPFLDALSSEHHVLAMSVSGVGSSGWAAPYRIADWVNDVVAVATSATSESVIAVAHSAGALFAFGAAARNPDRFAGVVSLDQVLDVAMLASVVRPGIDYWQHVRSAGIRAGGDAAVMAELLGEIEIGDQRMRDVLPRETLLAWGGRGALQDPAVFDQVTPDGLDEWLFDPAITDLPGSYRGPVLFIDGDPEAGSLVSDEGVAANLDRIPWAHRVQLAGRDHDLGLGTDPAEVIQALRPFVAAVAAMPRSTRATTSPSAELPG
jgi:pimeloyl-ACP methyl ester carboxylesterase